MKARMRLWFLPAVTLAIAGGVLAAFWAAGPVPVTAQPATPNITIAGPGGSVNVGDSFDVNISINSGAAVFNTYQVEMDVPAGLSYMSAAHQATAAFPSCFDWAAGPAPGTAGPFQLSTACGHGPPDAAFSGLVETLTLRCDQAGTFPLNFVDVNEDPSGGTSLIDVISFVITNTTPDGEQSVNCGGGGPPAATPTPGGPSPTPGAVPPGMEAVPLVEGCQFVAWTGADGTSPEQLASHVGPAGNLLSLWAQQPAPTWKGYSPEFPQVSDMEPLNLLDVVAICMTGPGTFERPVI
jgi:hypothetical protein